MSSPSLSSPVNLSFRVVELIDALDELVKNDAWLDAAMAAGAISQAIDDAVAGSSSAIGRVSKTISKASPAAGKFIFDVTRGARATRAAVPVVNASAKRVVSFRAAITAFSIEAAKRAVSDGPFPELTVDDIVNEIPKLPWRIQTAVVRIPSCFRSFDQHPRDFQKLVEKFTQQFEDRTRPVVVMGVRTSGSYLAPFIAAYLKLADFSDVSIVSARSEQPLSFDDAHTVRAAAKHNALVIIADDPPSSGYALDSVCKSLVHYGVAKSQIVLMLALFTKDAALPERLQSYQSVLLGWNEWSIHERLNASNVARIVTDFLDQPLKSCDVKPLSTANREHESVLITAYLRDGTRPKYVAEGVGLGYFADHDRVIGERLAGIAPDVLGVVDGVLYRKWVEGDSSVESQAVVDYLKQRVREFAVADDRSGAYAGSQPVWEVASNQVSRVYGRFWSIARLLYVDKVTRWLLRANTHAVVDGAMAGTKWFVEDGKARKISVADHAFGNRDLITFDPAFDAVSYALQVGSNDVADAYSQQVETISYEKRLLYELVQIWDDKRSGKCDRYETAERRGSAYRQYLSRVYFSDITPNEDGKLVALDVDGVLESEFMGFKAPTPSSALAVRALIQHGYRPIAVTGRCVDDVVEIRDAFKLSGGVAEYGSALVIGDGVQSQVTDESAASLSSLRRKFDGASEVRVDPRYTHVVRASTVTSDGKLKTLDNGLYELDQNVQQVVGNLQTDFVASAINKGAGVRAFAALLDLKSVAVAVGDTDADVSLFEAAEWSAVPGHATKSARDAAKYISRHPFQAGLLDIVAHLIGHKPGGCTECSLPQYAASSKVLLDMLRVSEGSQLAIPFRTLKAVRSLSKAQSRDSN